MTASTDPAVQPSRRYTTPYGTYDLRRFPARADEPLQAWSGADTLLLEEAARLGTAPGDCLVVNDEHGALSVALQPVSCWTDSALSAIALDHNLQRNQQSPVPVTWSTQTPRRGPKRVVLRVPKQLIYFEHQLATLATLLAPGDLVLAAGMDKHLSPRTADLLERFIGPTTRHRGQRKARVFSARRQEGPPPPPPAPAEYACQELGASLRSLANVFSREQLDLGSRFLLANLPPLTPADEIIDLACGNGVLGLVAFKRGLGRKVLFADESAMAIASARHNAANLFPHAVAGSFIFHHDDGLASHPGGPVDLILCNPPFHLHHVVDDFAGRRLLQQAASSLRPGGVLCLVANRHLHYGPVLRRCFRDVVITASNSRFNLWACQS